MTFIYGPDFRIADDQIRSRLSLRPTLRTNDGGQRDTRQQKNQQANCFHGLTIGHAEIWRIRIDRLP